ncbi:MAG: DUF1007 family protein [Roseovarius sp.]
MPVRAFFLISALLVSLAAAPARAHPHVFVDVGLTFETDGQGNLTGIEVTWVYDDLFSMLILSDYGLDPDGDMQLTEAERAQLIGFDLAAWPEGFEGALFIEADGSKLSLGPPEALTLRMEDGHIVTRHRRPVRADIPVRMTVRAFDPSYYAALSMSGEVNLPAGCTGKLAEADEAAADEKVETLGNTSAEDFFEAVEVGRYYADTLEVTCEPLS